jgi:hypothetical protein
MGDCGIVPGWPVTLFEDGWSCQVGGGVQPPSVTVLNVGKRHSYAVGFLLRKHCG